MSRLRGEDKAGLYITVTVHLTVIIILMLAGIRSEIRISNVFMMDFSREESYEKTREEEKQRQEKESFDEEINRRIEDMIAGRSTPEARNTAVNRAVLKDDRGTDAEKLYEDAERLERELKSGFQAEEDPEDYVSITEKKEESGEKDGSAEYSGPSVVSYDLGGRKASRLGIPAYKCYGGGLVVVLISVDNSGRVCSARIQEAGSSDDRCLREYALSAARQSRFSADPKAPARQNGDIVYQFIPQR